MKITGINVKNVIYGETVNIVVKLTRQSGNVSIVINNKKYSAVVVNGTSTIKIPNLDAGIYRVLYPTLVMLIAQVLKETFSLQ